VSFDLGELLLSVETGQLSEPFEVFTFELSRAPDEFGQRQHSVAVTNDGRAHALVSWYIPVEPFDSLLG
jgi:protein arginine N-methyltransferase 7